MKGKIKFYDETKGYGFIERDDGEADCFVHQSGLEDPNMRLVEGEAVEFDVEQGERGPKAVKVRKVSE